MTNLSKQLLDRTKLFRMPIAFGICVNCGASSPQATLLLNILEPFIDKCDMPDCDSEAVRVGVFEVIKYGRGKSPICEIRGLCERHKQFGMWNKDGGWSLE